MNGSQILKRTLPLIIALVLIIGIAVSCTLLNKDKAMPGIEDPDGKYLEVTEGGRTFTVKKSELYNQLKTAYGLDRLIEEINRDLLTGPDHNYLNDVTEQEIEDAIKEDKFPNGEEDLTEEEREKAEKKFLDNMLLQKGLSGTAISDYYRLNLAKEKYAATQLQKLIDEADEDDPYFTEDDYKRQYEADYRNGYWAIIVPFASKAEAETLLKQLGYSIHAKDSSISNDFARWVKKVDDEEVTLTTAEIVKAFIDMFNTVNANKLASEYPGAGDDTTNIPEMVKSGIQFTIDDGKYVFDTDEPENTEGYKNIFHYSYNEIVSFNSSVENLLRVTLKNYTPDATVESGKTWYTPTVQAYNNNSLFCFVLKLDEETVPELDDVRDEVYQALFDKKLTEDFIETEMAKLRADKGIIIYDEDLEAQYIDLLTTYNQVHKKTKAESKTVVAKVGDEEYTANELFNMLDVRYGKDFALSRINYLRVLNNPELNTIYDYYNSDLKESKKILDPEKWKEVKNYPITLRNQFLQNQFYSYGYPASIGWEKFLKSYIGIDDEQELKYFFLYNEVTNQFTESLSSVEELAEDSELWQLYQEKMQEIADKYFSVTGVHLLVYVKDEKGSPIHPDEWTQVQRDLAAELIAEVWKYYDAEPGTVQERLQAIAKMFGEAPLFLAGKPQNVADQPQGFDYVEATSDYEFEFAKYKTAGLFVKFEDLGSFGQGKMVKEFEDAVRSIWERDKTSQQPTPYQDFETGEYLPITTEFGYHCYINLSSTDIAKWTLGETSGVIPTLQMVKTYLTDSASKYLLDDDGEETTDEFTAEMKTAITTYYDPIYKEISGSSYVTSKLYEDIEGLEITFYSGNYTLADFNEYVNKRIESYQSNLVYLAAEE
ncbi:MAG: hypothetical protein GX661_00205 [Acholeplasmataceae bacterium]|nr:hypothetical protein [Acholeplasmataceae bacterium]